MVGHLPIRGRESGRKANVNGPAQSSERRDDREDRNRRIAGGIVEVTILAVVVWVVATGGSSDRPPVPPAPSVSAVPGPAPDLRWPAPAVRQPAHFVADLSTGETRPLPESLVGGRSYAVSPDGIMFAYSSGACPPCIPPIEVHTADVDGTWVRKIATPGVVDAFGPSWSPDGSMLVYQGSDGLDEVGDLYVVDLATGEVRRITDLASRLLSRFPLNPSFTPDGEAVLFQLPRGVRANTSDVDTRWDLWSVPIAEPLSFEYGLGIDLGILVGELKRTEAFKSGGEYRKCPGVVPVPLPASTYCEPPRILPTDPYDADGAHYGVIEERVPPIGASLMLPHLALRFAPIPEVALKLEAALGFPTSFIGLSAAYGPEL